MPPFHVLPPLQQSCLEPSARAFRSIARALPSVSAPISISVIVLATPSRLISVICSFDARSSLAVLKPGRCILSAERLGFGRLGVCRLGSCLPGSSLTGCSGVAAPSSRGAGCAGGARAGAECAGGARASVLACAGACGVACGGVTPAMLATRLFHCSLSAGVVVKSRPSSLNCAKKFIPWQELAPLSPARPSSRHARRLTLAAVSRHKRDQPSTSLCLWRGRSLCQKAGDLRQT